MRAQLTVRFHPPRAQVCHDTGPDAAEFPEDRWKAFHRSVPNT